MSGKDKLATYPDKRDFRRTREPAGGKLRHPRLLGLRDDKKARDVVRENKS